MQHVNRRSFVQLGGAALAAGLASSTAKAADRNDTIRAAVLGVNGRGKSHIDCLQAISGVELALLCDPDELVLAKRAAQCQEEYGISVQTETDLRRVFDRDDIDVVCIASPNHWHALSTIWACQAGKDVYVEKPGSHNLFEGRKMVEAARKYDRIVQHGVQLRSNPALQEAVKLLREGVIGDVYMARGLVYRWRDSIGNTPESSAPETLDWDLWQGPAQQRPYSKRFVHYNWHWHWEYGNGDVGNQGVHETDMCLWGLGVELPSEIVSMGGKFLWSDDKETPEVLSSSYLYPEENKMIEFEVRPWITNDETGVKVGNIFYGSEGFMTIEGYRGFKTFMGRKSKPGPSARSEDPLVAHFQNFIDAVRTRDDSTLNGPVETAHTSSGLAHLGNIAYRLGRKLNFDPVQEKFVDDPEADQMLSREYREPYVVPEVV